MKSFLESFPSMFTVEATKDRAGNIKVRTIKLPKGRESAHFFLKTTITTTKAAKLIGAQKGNLAGFLLGYTLMGKNKKETLDKLLKKLYALRVEI